MTDPLPGRYVFDVVDNNSAALEKASRTTYRSVWVAEERGSALDGRLAADILRASCPGLAVILLLDDVQEPQRQAQVKKEGSTRRSGSFDKNERSRCGSIAIGKRASLRPRGQQGGSGGRGKGPSTPKLNAISPQALLSRMAPEGKMKLSAADYVMKKPFSEETFRLLMGAVRSEKWHVLNPTGRMKAVGMPEPDDSTLSLEMPRLGNGGRTTKSREAMVGNKEEKEADEDKAPAADAGDDVGNNTTISFSNCRSKGFSNVRQDESLLPLDGREAKMEATDIDIRDNDEKIGDLPMLPESPLLPPAPKKRPLRIPRAMKLPRSALQVGALTVSTYGSQPPLGGKHSLLEMTSDLTSMPTACSSTESLGAPIQHMSFWGRDSNWHPPQMMPAIGEDLEQQQQLLAQPSPDRISLLGSPFSRHSDYTSGNSIVRQKWPVSFQFQTNGAITESTHQAAQSTNKRTRLSSVSLPATTAAATAAVATSSSYGFISAPASSAPAYPSRSTVSAGRSRKSLTVSSSSECTIGDDTVVETRPSLSTSGTGATWTSPQVQSAVHNIVSNSSQQSGEVLCSTLCPQVSPVKTTFAEVTCVGSSPFSSVAAAMSVPQRSALVAGEINVNGRLHGGTDSAQSSAMALVYDSEETVLEADAWPSTSDLGGSESGSGVCGVNTERTSGMTPLLTQGGSTPPSWWGQH